MNVYDPQWLAGHKMIDPDGVEVTPETVVTTDVFGSERKMQFHSISRAPGDGTGTNGKIIATIITGPFGEPWRSEFYPLPGYRIVPREGFDADAYYASH